MPKSQKPFLGIGAANAVSLFRNALCFVAIGLLFSTQASDYTLAFILTVAIIWMDGLDGFLARKLGESSPVGAVVDILSDRVVEQLYWVSFAVLGWIPLWMPLLVITRGVWVDGLRSFALQKGCTAFGESSMMKSWWGVLLTSSRLSRWTYAVTKAVAFAFMILAHQPKGVDNWSLQFSWIPQVAEYSAWIAVIFCVIRGIPVLLESRAYFSEELPSPTGNTP